MFHVSCHISFPAENLGYYDDGEEHLGAGESKHDGKYCCNNVVWSVSLMFAYCFSFGRCTAKKRKENDDMLDDLSSDKSKKKSKRSFTSGGLKFKHFCIARF